MKEFCGAWRVSTRWQKPLTHFQLGVSPCWVSLSVSGFRKTLWKGSGETEFKLFCPELAVKGKKGPCTMAWMDLGAGQVTTNTMLPGWSLPSHRLHPPTPGAPKYARSPLLFPCIPPCPPSGTQRNSPSEWVDLQSEFLQQAGLGGIGQDENHVHVAWPQAYQVTGVCYICEFCYLHKAFFRNLAVKRYWGIKILENRGMLLLLKGTSGRNCCFSQTRYIINYPWAYIYRGRAGLTWLSQPTDYLAGVTMQLVKKWL